MKKILILGSILVVLIGASVAALFFGPMPQQSSDTVGSSLTEQGSFDTSSTTETGVASSSDVMTASSSTDTKPATQSAPKIKPQKAIGKYIEIANPAGFVNTNDQPIKIADYIGKKVIMIDFLTYSCINCQRTFPYLTAWYNKYKDDGFIIIGIHTPEFAFEKDKQNVIDAMKQFGITFPIVLDNNYGTWNAYGNQYWPRKYIIDIHGNIVYDHIGEGGYMETEEEIQALLKERAQVLGDTAMGSQTSLAASSIKEQTISIGSPETYFGSDRNTYLTNGTFGQNGEQTLTLPSAPDLSKLYLGGTWNFIPEYAISGANASIEYKYNAKYVYIVAESPDGADIEVLQDGQKIDPAVAGADVDQSGVMHIKDSRLYTIVSNKAQEVHTLRLNVVKGTLHAYTFTFG